MGKVFIWCILVCILLLMLVVVGGVQVQSYGYGYGYDDDCYGGCDGSGIVCCELVKNCSNECCLDGCVWLIC